MTKLYKRSEITFAIVWIVAYVVLTSVADELSKSVGAVKSLTAVLHIAMSAVLCGWIIKNGLGGKYGLKKPDVSPRRMLYYTPLIAVVLIHFADGFAVRYSPFETVCFIVSMCCVGILEELIFRGLLFRAMEKNGLRQAIIVSSLTFGIGHIVNLINGSGRSVQDSLVQILFAILVGFVLVLIFHRSGSLIPCIVFHSLNNAVVAFQAEESALDPVVAIIINLAVCLILLGGYSLYLLKLKPAGDA